jgi:hypothetical protein
MPLHSPKPLGSMMYRRPQMDARGKVNMLLRDTPVPKHRARVSGQGCPETTPATPTQREVDALVPRHSSVVVCAAVAVLMACLSTSVQSQSAPGVSVRPVVPKVPSVTVRPVEPKTPPATTRPARTTVEPITQTSVLLVIDGKIVPSDSLELVRGQQVMIWIRELQNLGWGTVSSAPGGKSLLTGDGVSLSFQVGQSTAMVNSLFVKLPVNIYSKAGKTMVPLSFVVKSLGMNYELAVRPVATVVAGSKAAVASDNSIEGTVVLSGRGVPGLVVRVTDSDLKVVDGATARTSPDGKFVIEKLRDGQYYVYVYSGDNPDYFNRQSELVKVSGGKTAHVGPIKIGGIIRPKSPAVGAEIAASQGAIKFSWSACEGAATYKLTIRAQGKKAVLVQLNSTFPSLTIKAKTLHPGAKYEAEVEAYDDSGEYVGGTPGSGGAPWVFGVR